MFEAAAIFPPVLQFDFLKVFGLPVEAHEAGDEEFGAVFAGFGDGLVEEEGVADGAVEDAVEDVGEGFALFEQSQRGGLARRI